MSDKKAFVVIRWYNHVVRKNLSRKNLFKFENNLPYVVRANYLPGKDVYEEKRKKISRIIEKGKRDNKENILVTVKSIINTRKKQLPSVSF